MLRARINRGEPNQMQIGLGCAGAYASSLSLFSFFLSAALASPIILRLIIGFSLGSNSLLVFFSRATPTCKLSGENCASYQNGILSKLLASYNQRNRFLSLHVRMIWDGILHVSVTKWLIPYDQFINQWKICKACFFLQIFHSRPFFKILA